MEVLSKSHSGLGSFLIFVIYGNGAGAAGIGMEKRAGKSGGFARAIETPRPVMGHKTSVVKIVG